MNELRRVYHFLLKEITCLFEMKIKCVCSKEENDVHRPKIKMGKTKQLILIVSRGHLIGQRQINNMILDRGTLGSCVYYDCSIFQAAELTEHSFFHLGKRIL